MQNLLDRFGAYLGLGLAGLLALSLFLVQEWALASLLTIFGLILGTYLVRHKKL